MTCAAPATQYQHHFSHFPFPLFQKRQPPNIRSGSEIAPDVTPGITRPRPAVAHAATIYANHASPE